MKDCKTTKSTLQSFDFINNVRHTINMKFHQYFSNFNPFMQLLMLLIIVLVFLFVGSGIGLAFYPLFVSPNSEIDLLQIETNTPFMLFLQATSQRIGMLVPAVLFGAMFYPNAGKFLNIGFQKKHIIISLIGWGVFVTLIPVIDTLTVWNNSIHLPESMSALEERLRQDGLKSENLLKQFLTRDGGIGVLASNLFVIALIPAVCEEFLFRGVIQQTFLRWIGNKHIAIIITAAIFSIIHFDMFNFVPRFVMGIALGYLFCYSKSIWPSVIAHFFNNGSIVVLTYIFGSEFQSTNLFDSNTVSIILTSIGVIASIALIITTKRIAEKK